MILNDNMRVDPNPGFVLRGGGGPDEETYEYDSEGRILHRKDSNGEEEIYEYDADGIATCIDEQGEIYKFDQSGNMIYNKGEGLERWAEYNQFGKSVHYKEKDGDEILEEWGEYNSSGKLVHFWDSDGSDERWTYDEKDRLLKYEDSSGAVTINQYRAGGEIEHSFRHDRWREIRTWYNEKGLPVHAWNSDGCDEYWEYNELGKETYHATFQRKECRKEYDESGNLVHIKETKNNIYGQGYEEWREYDASGNLICMKNNTGFEEHITYDEAGRKLSYENNRGVSYTKEYNHRGNLVYCGHSNGEEEWYSYDERGNLTRYKKEKEEN
ncbi:RHS repeat protein [Sellimonas intestinalis]|uniref:RHS repeat protein n=1 Tax=Sellimonas intestinalis TaxID=1653434 RepID=UPI0015EBF49A|nr:RHS repeat protein [Sellimonas intestinalis]MBA2214179.1 RHS repeat protein [Sellimonas intestinalis]